MGSMSKKFCLNFSFDPFLFIERYFRKVKIFQALKRSIFFASKSRSSCSYSCSDTRCCCNDDQLLVIPSIQVVIIRTQESVSLALPRPNGRKIVEKYLWATLNGFERIRNKII